MSQSVADQDAGPGRKGGRIRLEEICLPLALVAGALVAAGPALRGWAAWRRRRDPGYSDLLPTLFDVNTEANVPSWFSAVVLLLCALAAGGVALLRRSRRSGAQRWAALAVLLGAMSLDEGAALHERLLGPLGELVLGDAATGALHHAWVLPGAGVAIALVAYSRCIARDLSPRPRSTFLLAVALYFAGAIGVEAAGAAVLDGSGDGIGYVIATSLEEGAEMGGMLLLLFTLLRLLDLRRGRDGDLVLSLAPTT